MLCIVQLPAAGRTPTGCFTLFTSRWSGLACLPSFLRYDSQRPIRAPDDGVSPRRKRLLDDLVVHGMASLWWSVGACVMVVLCGIIW